MELKLKGASYYDLSCLGRRRYLSPFRGRISFFRVDVFDALRGLGAEQMWQRRHQVAEDKIKGTHPECSERCVESDWLPIKSTRSPKP